jgi:hypothetical protein
MAKKDSLTEIFDLIADKRIPRDQLIRAVLQVIERLAGLLAKSLSVDDAWRILLGGCIGVMQAEYTPPEMADLLRQTAESIESGELKQPSVQ